MNSARFPDARETEFTDLITINEAAKIRRKHPSMICRLAFNGRLPAWKRNGQIVVRQSDVLRIPKTYRASKPETKGVQS